MQSFRSDRGFTADVHPHESPPSRRREGGRIGVLFALGLCFILGISMIASLGSTESVDDTAPASASVVLSYDFKVHGLNCTSVSRTQNGTHFTFNTADLPFDFSTVYFGDHESDTTYSRKYYSGSGILVSASGANAVMTLRESSGRFVSRIDYHGQAQIAFNGKVESVSYPQNMTTYEGTDQIIQDWRNNIWDPSEGVLVEHPSNVTLDSAKFYVMTLEPSATTDIPEFELMPTIAAAVIVLLIVLRNKSRE